MRVSALLYTVGATCRRMCACYVFKFDFDLARKKIFFLHGKKLPAVN